MLKKCSKCNTEKYTADFRKDNSTKDGFTIYCKICRREFDKSNYMLKYGVLAKARSIHRSAEVRTKLLEYKRQNPCIKCKESDPSCLDFHHVDPLLKSFNISTRWSGSWSSLQLEMKKCVILCANCHRKFHAGTLVL